MKFIAIAGLIFVLPFMILEWINRSDRGEYPLVLFAFMWVLAVAFFALLRPLVRTWRSHTSHPALPGLLSRVALAMLIAWFWIGLVVDQMPCFLGVPNCD